MFGFSRNSSINSIDVNEIDMVSGNINLIDVREPYEYKSGHLQMAKSVPMSNILTDPEKYLEKSEVYHIICHSGSRSLRTCMILEGKGYNLINVSGGIGRYRGLLKK